MKHQRHRKTGLGDERAAAAFVPRFVVAGLAESRDRWRKPFLLESTGAVLSVDISGFSELTRELWQGGAKGAEEMARILDTHFSRVASLVEEAGGDLFSFAGDGLAAFWSSNHAGEQSCLERSASCALRVREELHGREVSDDVRSALRVGVGAGRIVLGQVGGDREPHGKWQILVGGEAVRRAAHAQSLAQRGEVIVSSGERRLGPGFTTSLTPDGLHMVGESSTDHSEDARPPPRHPLLDDDILRPYLPAPVSACLDGSQAGGEAELRLVTILFAAVPDLFLEELELHRSQSLVARLQALVANHGGTLLRLGVDEHGAFILTVFGLPPECHDDDSYRAVRAALALQEELRGLGLRCALGLASGPAYCGTIGSAGRREYTVLGEVVNLASRLAAAAPGDVLADSISAQAGGDKLIFEETDPLHLKGWPSPVSVFRPYGVKHVMERRRNSLVGRDREVRILDAQLQSVRQGRSSVTLLLGEAGIGKSRLLEYVRESAALGHVDTVGAAGDYLERHTPLFVWRAIFGRLLGIDEQADPEARRKTVARLLETHGSDSLRLLPLLNSLLGLEVPENRWTAAMSDLSRANNTNLVLIKLLRGTLGSEPIILLFEDAHWMDSSSWELLRLAVQDVHPFSAVIASRPGEGELQSNLERLAEQEEVSLLELELLSPDEATRLASDTLGVDHLPSSVTELVHSKAGGHPFFTQELAYALRDGGFLEIRDGSCVAAVPPNEHSQLDFSISVQQTIVSRIDRLGPEEKVALKAASVLGRSFRLELLSNLLSAELPHTDIAEVVRRMTGRGLIVPDDAEPDGHTYQFRHAIGRDVTYGLLLHSHRVRYHRAAAQWYENSFTGAPAHLYPILAHHWRRAEVRDRALSYLEKAGEHALHSFANVEAASFFAEAVQIAEEDPGSVTDLRFAGFERRLGEAVLRMGRLEESLAHIKKSLDLFGYPIPEATAGDYAVLAGRIAGETVNRLLEPVSRSRALSERLEGDASERQRYAEVFDAYTTLAYAGLNLPPMTHLSYSLLLMRLAEKLKDPKRKAVAYAFHAFTLSMVPASGLSERYFSRAECEAEGLNDPEVGHTIGELVGFHALGQAQWRRAKAYLRAGAEAAERAADHRRWAECTGLGAAGDMLSGNILEPGARLSEMRAVGIRTGDSLSQIWALLLLAPRALHLGRPEEAFAYLREAEPLLSLGAGRLEEMRTYALLSLTHMRLHDRGSAVESLETALEAAADLPATAMYAYSGYAALADASLELLEDHQARSEFGRQRLQQFATQACDVLENFARPFPAAKPHSRLAEGRLAWACGRGRKARRMWTRGLSEAHRLQMPYEEALLLLELSHHSFKDGPNREEANDAFVRLGVPVPDPLCRSGKA